MQDIVDGFEDEGAECEEVHIMGRVSRTPTSRSE